jgi:FMN phosphatase YigB (HAD superfamily)
MNAKAPRELMFFFDVDNTLLDNDRAKADMEAQLMEVLGQGGSKRFWELYEEVRKEGGVVSYPRTIARFEEEWPDKVAAYHAANIVNGLPYEEYLFPGTVAALRRVSGMGDVAILSDGDPEYQPRKIARAGLSRIVGYKDVLVFVDKQEELLGLMQQLPARHYVLVDDKESILANAKTIMGEKLTTVWVQQGHYAHDPKFYREPAPDITLASIGDLCNLKKSDFLREG